MSFDSLQKALYDLSFRQSQSSAYDNYADGFSDFHPAEKESLTYDAEEARAHIMTLIKKINSESPSLIEQWIEFNLDLLQKQIDQWQAEKDEDLQFFYEQKIFSAQTLMDQWQAFRLSKNFALDLAHYWHLDLEEFISNSSNIKNKKEFPKQELLN